MIDDNFFFFDNFCFVSEYSILKFYANELGHLNAIRFNHVRNTKITKIAPFIAFNRFDVVLIEK